MSRVLTRVKASVQSAKPFAPVAVALTALAAVLLERAVQYTLRTLDARLPIAGAAHVRFWGLGIAEIVAALYLLWALPKLSHQTLSQIGLRPMKLTDGLWIIAGFVGTVLAGMLNHMLQPPTGARHVQTHYDHIDFANLTVTISFVITLTFITPFAEELFFRALWFRAVEDYTNTFISLIVTSAVFAAVHLDLYFAPALFALGVFAAYGYWKTGNLFVAIGIHALNNAWSSVLLLYDSTHT